MSDKNAKKPKTPSTSNKKQKGKQEPAKPKDDKSQVKAPTEQVKASIVITADDVVPLDPAKAGTGTQRHPPAGKKMRGPDLQPRKKRSDAKPDSDLEVIAQPVPVIDPATGPEQVFDAVMELARVNTTAFVVTFDVMFCGWAPPRLTEKDKKMLIEVWVPLVYANDGKIPAWLPAGLVTLGIMAERLITKFSKKKILPKRVDN